jgi:DNA polymerase-3 subunit gamma/tau
LATTEIHKVPATILSRCQRYTFNRHNVSDTVNHLRQIAITEGYHIEAGVAEAIARAATGSMRDALSIFDQLMSYGSGQVSMAMVQGLLGVTAAQEVIILAEALLNSDVASALQVVARVASQGADMRQFSRDIVQHLRLVMLVKADPNGTAIEAAESEADAVRDQAKRAQMGSLVYWLRRMSELDYELRTSPYGQLPLELAVVEAIAGPPVSSAAPASAPVSRPAAPPSATPVRPSGGEVPRPSAPAPTPAPTPAPATTPRPVSPPPSHEQHNEPAPTPAPVPASAPLGDRSPLGDVTDLLERWPAIIRDLRSKSRNLEALIKSGIAPIDIQGTVITLKADNEWLLNKIQERTNVTILEEVIARYAGVSYTIRSVAEAAKRDSGSALREQIRDTTTNPLVRAAMNVFDADVVSIENPDQGETA